VDQHAGCALRMEKGWRAIFTSKFGVQYSVFDIKAIAARPAGNRPNITSLLLPLLREYGYFEYRAVKEQGV
jgi:hypothetical protein